MSGDLIIEVRHAINNLSRVLKETENDPIVGITVTKDTYFRLMSSASFHCHFRVSEKHKSKVMKIDGVMIIRAFLTLNILSTVQYEALNYQIALQ